MLCHEKIYNFCLSWDFWDLYHPNERHLINQSDKQLLKIQSVKHGKSFSIVIQTNSHFLVPRPLFRAANVVHTVECSAYFETQPSSEVLEEFSGTFCTLYSRKLCFEKEINVFTSKYTAFLRRFKHLEISFSARLEICVGFCHLILLLINWFYLHEPIHEPVYSVTRIAFKN